MRNATVAALIYEFLFDVYRMIEFGRRHNHLRLPDERGVVREAFDHGFISCWEWSTSVLEIVGATKALRPPTHPGFVARHGNRSFPSPYCYPTMTLEECRVADFSDFETFDNYCYAMFTLEQLIGHTSGSRGAVNLGARSPRFLEAVASEDDIFLTKDIHSVKFRNDRFKEKVLTHWREIDLRQFRRKEGL